MKNKMLYQIFALSLTLFLIFIVNLLSSTVMPWLGLNNISLLFHVLVVLFICFYVRDDFVAIYIFMAEFVNSLFSIQGWEIGTITGSLIAIVLIFSKSIVELSSAISTMIFCFMGFILWYIIYGLVYYTKIHEIDFFFSNIWIFLFEIVILSVLSPFVFSFLKSLWRVEQHENIASF